MPIPDGSKVRTLRKRDKFRSHTAFGVACSLGRETVAKVERSEDSTEQTLQNMARVLRIAWEDLLDPQSPQNQEILSQRKWTIHDVLSDLLAWEVENSSPEFNAEPLHIDTIALDLADGWKLIVEAVERTQSQTLRIRIAMLAGPREKLLDRSVEDFNIWADTAVQNLQKVKNKLADGGFPGNKDVNLTIYTYGERPDLHGIAVKKGTLSRLAATRCKNIGMGWYWGDRDYVIIDPNCPPARHLLVRDEWEREISRKMIKSMINYKYPPEG